MVIFELYTVAVVYRNENYSSLAYLTLSDLF